MDHTINLKKHEREEEERRFVREPNFTEVKPAARPRMPFKKRHVFIVIITLLVIFGVWECVAANSQWRAVFLTNNQVYFGKFWDMPFSHTIHLSDVYYLQVNQGIQPAGDAAAAQPQLKVIKLGGEIHGPTSEMFIPMNQVLYWENLRSDSALVKTIEQSGK